MEGGDKTDNLGKKKRRRSLARSAYPACRDWFWLDKRPVFASMTIGEQISSSLSQHQTQAECLPMQSGVYIHLDYGSLLSVSFCSSPLSPPSVSHSSPLFPLLHSLLSFPSFCLFFLFLYQVFSVKFFLPVLLLCPSLSIPGSYLLG